MAQEVESSLSTSKIWIEYWISGFRLAQSWLRATSTAHPRGWQSRQLCQVKFKGGAPVPSRNEKDCGRAMGALRPMGSQADGHSGIPQWEVRQN